MVRLKIKVIHQDILDVECKPGSLLAHQVNCSGIMEHGTAARIKEKYNTVFIHYYNMCSISNYNREKLLGEVLFVKTKNDLVICNVFSQDTFNQAYRDNDLANVHNNYQYTDYSAMKVGFKKIRDYMKSLNPYCNLYITYMFGCKHGGGDWNIVLDIIKESFYDVLKRVYICGNDVTLVEDEI